HRAGAGGHAGGLRLRGPRHSSEPRRPARRARRGHHARPRRSDAAARAGEGTAPRIPGGSAADARARGLRPHAVRARASALSAGRRRSLGTVTLIAAIALALAVALIAALYALQDRMLFFPRPLAGAGPSSSRIEPVEVAAEDGA